MFAQQHFKGMFGHFSTVGMKELREFHLIQWEKKLRKGNRKMNMMVVLSLDGMIIWVIWIVGVKNSYKKDEVLSGTLHKKCINFRVFLVCIFPHSHWMRKFTLQISLVNLNVGNSGPKKSAKSDAVHGEKVKGLNREYYLEGSAYLEGRR